MSGRGRKQPNRGAKGRRPQPAARKSAGTSRTATAIPSPRREQLPAHAAAASHTRDTRPVADVRSRRSAAAGPGSAREERRQRAERRKRNQRLGVVIGAVALGGAAIGGVIAGMAGAEPADGTVRASSSVAASAGPTVDPNAGQAVAAAPAPPAPMSITCPTGGGASTLFGHDITVPGPYSVTITYGDGDEYTNDNAHLSAIFSHTYADPGTYTVSAVLTAPAGATASATCDYTWGP